MTTMGTSSGDIGAQLRRVPLFADLDDASLAILAARCRRRRFPAGEALFHEGDPGQTLYVVVSGQINVEKVTARGDTVHLAQRGPGETVGEMSLLDGEARSGDAVTETACDLLMLDRGEFLRCLETAPQIALNVITCLAARLREAGQQRIEDRSLDVLGRLATFLLAAPKAECAADATHEKGGMRLESRLSHAQIAERIGATRETVSRALGRLREGGALCQGEDGRFVVLNADKLRRLCQS